MSKPTREEVDALADEIEEWQQCKFTEAAWGAWQDRLEAFNRRAGPDLSVGTLLAFDFEDGVACYLVVEILKTIVIVRGADIMGGYHDDRIARLRSDGRYTVARDVAEDNVRRWQRYL